MADKPQDGSTFVPTWVFGRMAEVTDAEFMILVAIPHQRQVHPERTLAEITGLPSARVDAALKALARRRFIVACGVVWDVPANEPK